MTTTPELRPQPAPDPDSLGYWQSLADGKFAIQRCEACRAWQFPPLEVCRHCSGALRYEGLAGTGTVHTFIVQHHKVAPGFDDERPYPIALVTPDEAPEARVPGRIVGARADEVRIGARVQAEVVALPGGSQRLVAFRLLGG